MFCLFKIKLSYLKQCFTLSTLGVTRCVTEHGFICVKSFPLQIGSSSASAFPLFTHRTFVRLLLRHLIPHRRHKATQHFFRTQTFNVLWQGATPIIVGWFAGNTWKNNNRRYK